MQSQSASLQSTILVVDDEELYRRALERILLRTGHQVAMAADASEALRVASSQRIDLVLCDIQMPGINGLELVRQLHELEPDLPCIVMTGYNTPEKSVEALQAGAFWYLEKPFEQERLDVVRGLVDGVGLHARHAVAVLVAQRGHEVLVERESRRGARGDLITVAAHSRGGTYAAPAPLPRPPARPSPSLHRHSQYRTCRRGCHY